jgi:hypothetical protein
VTTARIFIIEKPCCLLKKNYIFKGKIMQPTILSVEIPSDEAEALAEFLKRVGFSDFRSLAKSDEEAYLMQAGAAKVAKSLADVGYAPR